MDRRQIGRRLEGGIDALGSQYVVSLTARRCASGDVLDAEQVQAARKEDVLKAVSQLASRFRSRVGESLATVGEHNTPLAEHKSMLLEDPLGALLPLQLGRALVMAGEAAGAKKPTRSLWRAGRTPMRASRFCATPEPNTHSFSNAILLVMTRRDLGKLAMTSGTLLQVRAQAPRYTGALDGLHDKLDMTGFDPVHFTDELYRSAPLRMTFHAQTRKQAEQWQARLRAKLVELVGGFPEKRPSLEPQTLEVREFPLYRREKFVFESRPGVSVLGYLLIPKSGAAPHPAVICVPGHGRGVDDIVGIDDHGRDRAAHDGYQYDFAIQAAEHGMAAVAIEPMGFGCRRDAANQARGLGQSSCQPTAGAALLLGQTMIGWRVYDVMRTIDWIETRPELDAKRVGCMGISGGGTCTLFSTALEPRLRAALVSGYLNTFQASIMSISHCIDNYVPGILNWAEAYDVAGLIAPRPLFVESGERDNIFPVAASRASFDRVKKVYEVFDAGAMTEQETFDGPHSFWGKRGLPFLAKHLA